MNLSFYIWCDIIEEFHSRGITCYDSITYTYPKFFTTNPDKQIKMVEALVTQRLNPIVRHLTFAFVSQVKNEPI